MLDADPVPNDAAGMYGVVALAGLLTLLAQNAAAAVTPLPVEEVAPGVYVHHGVHEEATPENLGGIANIGFVIGDTAVAVIDSGGSVEEGEALLAAIRARTALPVRYVINTHFHPDHVMGNRAFVGPGTEFVAHANLPRSLAVRQEGYRANLAAALGRAVPPEATVLPQHLVSAEETLDLGHRTLALQAYPPAHTDSDLTVLDEATQTLFAGDLVFLERTPAVDGSLLGWLNAIAAMKRVPAARVVPGHGPVSAPWPMALADEERYLNVLLAETRDFLAKGGSLDAAPAAIGQSERDRWQLFEDYNARNVTAAYTELEWE